MSQSAFGFTEPATAGGGETRGAAGQSSFRTLLGSVAKRFQAPAAPRPGPFSREVEAKLGPLLSTGAASVDAVARAMGVSRQTLYRRLKEEGATFEQLLDDLRRRLALRHVGRDGLSAKEAAWRLGFSDPAAFSRAFKRWTGRSPSRYP